MKSKNVFSAALLIIATNSFAGWQPIIGIPKPPFGVEESHAMYSDCSKYKYDYGQGDQCYRVGADGPFTHYIEPNRVGATDVNNPLGTPEIPRVSFPENSTIAPGSVIQIVGTMVAPNIRVSASATTSRPTFVRGSDPKVDVVKASATDGTMFRFLESDNYIFENLAVDLNGLKIRAMRFGLVDHSLTNFAIRNCEFKNSTGEGNLVVSFGHNFPAHNTLSSIVIWKNRFHDLGTDRTTLGTDDHTAIALERNTKNVWIVDNEFYRIGGDGVYLAHDAPPVDSVAPHHIYIGRNLFHDLFENAVDVKMANHVILSQNVAHSFGPEYCTNCGPNEPAFRQGEGNGSPAEKRSYIWTLYNLVYNSSGPDGVFNAFEGADKAPSNEIYFIGNIAYHIRGKNKDARPFASWNQERIYWLNNVAFDTDVGAAFWGDSDDTNNNEKLTIMNNIFGTTDQQSSRPFQLYISGTEESLSRADVESNLFYQEDGVAKLRFGSFAGSVDDFVAAVPSKAVGSVEADPRLNHVAELSFVPASDSPVVDRGSSIQRALDTFEAQYGMTITSDYEGESRVVDGDNDGVAKVDIGPLEIAGHIIPIPPALRLAD
ncbi:right-handed parallel beta-helix repeat-containing protein [Thiorhodococcus minor]|uniref:Right handed beta helix domain-containing protein n=1 Tax=Thiorhodococcus minor TaxID=57489 RepID=A0A6M0K7E2_9GAMM|nr:right-handed parallel beta-helix repeat-containing protein [Thiorhodococcus minor]NEV65214.1 hypothetical protein [Thiorhodococcus minor]